MFYTCYISNKNKKSHPTESREDRCEVFLQLFVECQSREPSSINAHDKGTHLEGIWLAKKEKVFANHEQYKPNRDANNSSCKRLVELVPEQDHDHSKKNQDRSECGSYHFKGMVEWNAKLGASILSLIRDCTRATITAWCGKQPRGHIWSLVSLMDALSYDGDIVLLARLSGAVLYARPSDSPPLGICCSIQLR